MKRLRKYTMKSLLKPGYRKKQKVQIHPIQKSKRLEMELTLEIHLRRRRLATS